MYGTLNLVEGEGKYHSKIKWSLLLFSWYTSLRVSFYAVSSNYDSKKVIAHSPLKIYSSLGLLPFY